MGRTVRARHGASRARARPICESGFIAENRSRVDATPPWRDPLLISFGAHRRLLLLRLRWREKASNRKAQRLVRVSNGPGASPRGGRARVKRQRVRVRSAGSRA